MATAFSVPSTVNVRTHGQSPTVSLGSNGVSRFSLGSEIIDVPWQPSIDGSGRGNVYVGNGQTSGINKGLGFGGSSAPTTETTLSKFGSLGGKVLNKLSPLGLVYGAYEQTKEVINSGRDVINSVGKVYNAISDTLSGKIDPSTGKPYPSTSSPVVSSTGSSTGSSSQSAIDAAIAANPSWDSSVPSSRDSRPNFPLPLPTSSDTSSGGETNGDYGGDTLISVLQSSNAATADLTKKLVASLALVAAAIAGKDYAPDNTPSNIPEPVKNAVQPYVDDSSAQWSDDGNSLVFQPSTAAYNDVGRSVVNGSNLSGQFIPEDLKSKASTVYPDLGLVPQNQWVNGLSNVAYDPDKLALEGSIINQYLDGSLTSSQARDKIANIRNNSLIPLETVSYVERPMFPGVPNSPTTTDVVRTPVTPTIPNSYAPQTASVSSAPVVNVTVPAPEVNIENKIDFEPVKTSLDSIVQKMPNAEKIDAVNDAKKESLDYKKTALFLPLIDGEPAVNMSPRDAETLSNAQNQLHKKETNNMRFDDDDFDLTDMVMEFLPFKGVSSDLDAIHGLFELPSVSDTISTSYTAEFEALSSEKDVLDYLNSNR